MSYDCKILADSIDQGHRLTTFEITFPRFILAEVNTHRMLSRNSASSRAIPVAKSIAAVQDDPFVPLHFGRNQKGMSAGEDLGDEETNVARDYWEFALGESLYAAEHLASIGVHKALANRVLEPYKWHTAILSGTDWLNFFGLRTDPNAQPEFRRIALMMREAYHESAPKELSSGEWHLPLVTEDEINAEALQYSDPWIDWTMWKQVSIGRCARVSYLTHDGKRDPEADVALAERLKTNGHLSPFEHVARPFTGEEWRVIHDLQDHLARGDEPNEFTARLYNQLEYCGNYCGWLQARYEVPDQDDFSKVLADAVHSG